MPTWCRYGEICFLLVLCSWQGQECCVMVLISTWIEEYSTLDGVFPAFLTIDGSCFQSNPHWFPEAEIQHPLKWNKAFICECMLDGWKGHSIEKQVYTSFKHTGTRAAPGKSEIGTGTRMLSALNDSSSFLFCRSALSTKLEQWLLPIASYSTSYQHRYPQEGTFLPVFAVVQLQSHVWLFVNPRTAACQALLSFIIS